MSITQAAIGSARSEQPVFLSLLPPQPGERRFAFAIMVLSLAIFLALAPFAQVQLARIDAFIPLYQSALVVNDLVTAALLFGQFSILRSRSLLILANAYIFTALMVVAHTLSFPGLFTPGGLLGAGPQTTAWIYMFWHGGFPLLVIGYVGARHAKVEGSVGRAMVLSLAATAAAVIGLVAWTTAGQAWLPAIMAGNHYTPEMIVVVSLVWVLSLAALFSLWRRRNSAALDLWLIVVVGAWLLDMALAAMLNAGRFDLGFYAGRIYGLVAASTVLMVLLLETRSLFARHARNLQDANQALRESEERLRQFNDTLEQRVQERSQQLEAETAEREQIQAALRQAQKLEVIGRITGGIAHDFNNLLTVIVNYAEVLRQQLRDGPELASVQAIEQAAERGVRLVRQLMTFSRHRAVKTEAIDLAARSKEITELLRQSLRGDIRLIFDLPEDLWRFECDGDELDLGLINLCLNARDAMPNGGLVRIQARNVALTPERDPILGLNGDFVAISVTDTGIGIAEPDLKMVFEPFFSTKEVGKGTGLGLSQVYGFAQQVGGRATVDSMVGQGTTVTLYLPRAMNEPAAVASAPDDRRQGRGRILLVEDDDAVAELAAKMLVMIGYDSHRVRDARTALALLMGGQSFDVLFSDMIMPGGMNGLELAKTARSHFPKLPILLSSGFAYASAEIDRQGFNIIAKPYRADGLAAALERAIAESYRDLRSA